MTAKELLRLTSETLVKSISSKKGLSQFATEKSKFEGWFKVEFIDALILNNIAARPEIDRIDVTFVDTAIELKTINTNYRFENVEPKTRPITRNVNGVISDIHSLKRAPYKNKFVVFIVFPVHQGNREWFKHLSKIEEFLIELKSVEFKFENDVPGILYYGRI